ncbi:hypothetical protein ACGFWI_24290 [Streptomyces sp. NPDC048434]|uniref:hypothetical protein n=1 Tax=Streptomyces sp. NPDC048434 TaxID=3365549 RepID=UPI003716DB89
MAGGLQGDLPPAGEAAGMLRESIFCAHALGDVLVETLVAPLPAISHPIRTILDLRTDGMENSAAPLLLTHGVLQGHNSGFRLAKVTRSGPQSMGSIFRIKRAMLEARAQDLCPRGEGIGRRAVPVLPNICHSLVQQIPHTAIGRIASHLIMDMHPVIGDLFNLARLCVLHHALQLFERMARKVCVVPAPTTTHSRPPPFSRPTRVMARDLSIYQRIDARTSCSRLS